MIIQNEQHMKQFGRWLGERLRGGELLELRGDVGAGKTTFTRGLAEGLGVSDTIQSPTFTISREYEGTRGRRLVHYDFYRLHEPGIIADELAESIHEPHTVSVVEWSDIVADVLPDDRIIIAIMAVAASETQRMIECQAGGELASLIEGYEDVRAA